MRLPTLRFFGLLCGGLLCGGVAAQSNPFELLQDFDTATASARNSAPDPAPQAVGGVLGNESEEWPSIGAMCFFAARAPSAGVELFRTLGSPGSTSLVADIAAGSASSMPSHLLSTGSRLFFVANDGLSGRELWTSDGTAAGTHLVRDIYPGNTASSPQALCVLGNRVVFDAEDGSAGTELWISDGSSSGTSQLADIPGTSRITLSIGMGSYVLFACSDSKGEELWITDGTSAGTKRLVDIQPGSGSSSPGRFRRIGSQCFFCADDGTHGRELWVSDGTAVGTRMVADLYLGAPSGFDRGQDLKHATEWNGKLCFAALMGSGKLVRYGICISDGSAAGTTQLAPLPAFFGVEWMSVVASKLYFSFDDLSHGAEPWVSDGTAAGTFMLGDLRPGSSGSKPTLFQQPTQQSIAVFIAQDGTTNRELWTTDGTASGTHQLIDIVPGVQGSDAAHLGRAPSGVLLFSANDRIHGEELWVSSGSASSTTILANIEPDPNASSLPSNATRLGAEFLLTAKDSTDVYRTWTVDPLDKATVVL